MSLSAIAKSNLCTIAFITLLYFYGNTISLAQQAIESTGLVTLSTELPPLDPKVKQSMIDYTHGVTAMNKRLYAEAIAHLKRAVLNKPTDAHYRYMLAMAFEGDNKYLNKWFQLRQAVRLELEHDKAASAFLTMWKTALDKGILDVGKPATEVLAALGKPDAPLDDKNQVNGTWPYGFMAVRIAEGQVQSVIDLRGSGPFKPATETIEMPLPAADSWKLKLLKTSRLSSSLEFVPVTATEILTESKQEQFVIERLVDLKQQLNARQLMQRMQSQLQQQFPQAKIDWQLLQDNADDILFEWRLHKDEQSEPSQYELTRLIAGSDDIHRLAYTTKSAATDSAQRDSWLERIKAASLVADQ